MERFVRLARCRVSLPSRHAVLLDGNPPRLTPSARKQFTVRTQPFAIGRKNWLFFGNDDGGRRLAILSSFTATCQQFGVNPWTWLKETLTRLPATPADHLHTLLPTPSLPASAAK